MITQKKWQQLNAWMESLDISEEDISEQFILGSGSGGQKLQKNVDALDEHNKKSLKKKNNVAN